MISFFPKILHPLNHYLMTCGVKLILKIRDKIRFREAQCVNSGLKHLAKNNLKANFKKKSMCFLLHDSRKYMQNSYANFFTLRCMQIRSLRGGGCVGDYSQKARVI